MGSFTDKGSPFRGCLSSTLGFVAGAIDDDLATVIDML